MYTYILIFIVIWNSYFFVVISHLWFLLELFVHLLFLFNTTAHPLQCLFLSPSFCNFTELSCLRCTRYFMSSVGLTHSLSSGLLHSRRPSYSFNLDYTGFLSWGCASTVMRIPRRFSYLWRSLCGREISVLRSEEWRAKATLYTGSPMTAQPKVWTLFPCSNTGVVGSNPTRGMDICL
jgi:hypothetical protein